MAKKKPGYGWVFVGDTPAGRTEKPTSYFKSDVEQKMKVFIKKLKEENIIPIPESHDRNHLIDIYGKWKASFYYIYLTYKCPEEGYRVDKFDTGLARLRYVGKEKFDISYFRHTGKWEDLPFYKNLSLEEAMTAIQEGDWFEI
jgi:hypothetical protein